MKSRGGLCRGRRALLLSLLLAGALVGCGKKDTVSGVSDADRDILFELNARENDGRTIRWVSMPVVVFLGDTGDPEEVTPWTGVSEGRVTFQFVGSPPPHGVTFRTGSLPSNVCGESQIFFFRGDGRIDDVQVTLNPDIYRGPQCRGVTVLHETGHAIGIINHTSDGGLMDRNGGDGQITPDVQRFVRALYSLPANTRVRQEAAPGAPSTGRGVITIIDYAHP